MTNWKEKYGSRKFLMNLLAVVISVMALMNIDDSLIQMVSLIGGIIVPVLSYTIIEGVIDARRVLSTALEIIDIVDGDEEEEPIRMEGTV